MAQQRQSMGQLEWDSSNKKSALRCHMSNCLCSNQGERITLITRVIRVLAASVINIRVICCLSFEAILCLCFCLSFELRSPSAALLVPSPLLELRSPSPLLELRHQSQPVHFALHSTCTQISDRHLRGFFVLCLACQCCIVCTTEATGTPCPAFKLHANLR